MARAGQNDVLADEPLVEMEIASVQNSPRAIPDNLDLSAILRTANALVADVLTALNLPSLLDEEPLIALGPPASPRFSVVDGGDDDLSGSDGGGSDAGGAKAVEWTPSWIFMSPRSREATRMLWIMEEEIAWEEVRPLAESKRLRSFLSFRVSDSECLTLDVATKQTSTPHRGIGAPLPSSLRKLEWFDLWRSSEAYH